MSAIIETRTRGDFHVTADVREVRHELRAALPAGAVFTTQLAGQPVAIRYDEVWRVRSPDERPRWRRRLDAWLMFLIGLTLNAAGVLLICLGGAAAVLALTGHASDTTYPWTLAPAGFVTYYAGGWIGHHACDQLGIE